MTRRHPLAEDFTYPRAEALPMSTGVVLRLGGVDRVNYNFASSGPRPFFFPIFGPGGHHLTRLGHPGDPVGHSHHLSVWFAHEKVDGVNFWSDRPGTDVQIRHRQVVCYQDGPDWSAFAAELDWWADGRSRLRQFLIAALGPTPEGLALDLQSRFEAPRGAPVELGRTNFGFLGVRVAKTMSELFGGGRLTNSEGATGEDAIFGKPARWVDDSGPVAPGVVEGIAYFDHPSNPHHPTLWHVRRDGWMCASFNQGSAFGVATDHPLTLRYRLLFHPGPAFSASLDQAFDQFASTPPYVFTPAGRGTFPRISRET